MRWRAGQAMRDSAHRTQLDHHIESGHFHARGSRRQAAELHFGQCHIRQDTRGLVMKVVVRLDVGIEPAPRVIDRQLSDQAAGREQIKRVVDRRLGDAQPLALQCIGDLLSRQVLGTCQQQPRYLQTLREIGGNENSTIVFPFPLDLLHKLQSSVNGEQTAAVAPITATDPLVPAIAGNGSALAPGEPKIG